MKAKQIPRIDIHDRIELKNALPLRTPYVIYIDPCDTCNFRCKFCPSGNVELMKKTKGHGPMVFEVYKSIIDSLQEFPDPIRVIRLYKESEPLVNPHFADIVRYTKRLTQGSADGCRYQYPATVRMLSTGSLNSAAAAVRKNSGIL